MDREQLLKAAADCRYEKHARLVPVEKVKPKQLQNALKHICKIPPKGEPVLLMDTTLFGSGKEGVLVTETNMYVRIGFYETVPLDNIISVSATPGKDAYIRVTYRGRQRKDFFASIYCGDLRNYLSLLISKEPKAAAAPRQAAPVETETVKCAFCGKETLMSAKDLKLIKSLNTPLYCPYCGKAQKAGEAPAEAPAPKPVEAPKAAPAPKPVEAPKAASAPKPVEAPRKAPAPKPVEAPKPVPAPVPVELPKAAKDGPKVGDRIFFGRYPTAADGAAAPIEWVVLDRQKDKILVLSTKILEQRVFQEKIAFERTYANWEDSDIREWLSHRFIWEAFSNQEAEQICRTRLSTSSDPEYACTPGSRKDSGAKPCPDTEDDVFLLSWEEVCKYLCGGKLPEYRSVDDAMLGDPLVWYSFPGTDAAAKGTAYYRSKGDDETEYGDWLLRNAHSNDEVLYVSSGSDVRFEAAVEILIMEGDIPEEDPPALTPGCIREQRMETPCGIRPALWLKLDSFDSRKAVSVETAADPAQVSADACEKLAQDFACKWEAALENYRGQPIPREKEPEIYDCLNRAVFWAKTGQEKGSSKCGELFRQLLSYRTSHWRFCAKGSTLYFGRYAASGDGKDAPIPWKVLSRVGDHRLLVVSEYVLDRRAFADTDACSWADSSIRSWLNGEFLEKAFRECDTGNISQTLLQTSVNPDYDCLLKTDPSPDIIRFTAPSPDTTDRVFLLSWEEVCKYLCDGETPVVQSGGFTAGKREFRRQLRWYQFKNKRPYAYSTAYAGKPESARWDDESGSYSTWMLRNPCSPSQLLVADDGEYLREAQRKGIWQPPRNPAYRPPERGSICVRSLTEPYGVRPAMWLELDDYQ